MRRFAGLLLGLALGAGLSGCTDSGAEAASAPRDIAPAPPLLGSQDGPLGRTPEPLPEPEPEPLATGTVVRQVEAVGPLNAAMRPILDDFEDQITDAIHKIKVMRATGKAENKLFITVLDNYEHNAERLLQSLDALTVPPPAQPGFNAIVEFYEEFGDRANAQKEAYFDSGTGDIMGAESETREFAQKGRASLVRKLETLGYDGALYRDSRVLAKRGQRPF